jgi:hypothetical protein
MQEETFSFEHAMAHRGLMGSMSPLDRFSVVPYILDPGKNNGDWHQDHQQSHNDFQGVLPGFLGGLGFNFPGGSHLHPLPPPPASNTLSQLGPTIFVQDYELSSKYEREWWTFQNHYAHLNATSVQNLSEPALVFPFF